MRKLFAVILSLLALSVFGQSYYSQGLKISSFTSSSAALLFVQNDLDSRQQAHATILPLRIIDGPLAQNPPDVLSYVVLWQPSDNNSTDGMTNINTTTAPSVTWANGLCGGSITAPYTADDYTSSSSALAAFGNLDVHIRPFAGLLAHPENSTYLSLVYYPINGATHCQ